MYPNIQSEYVSTPSLNILFPVYNEENRLQRGIEQTANFLAQNLSANYRLTIVDNASTDRTQDIANELCAANNRIHYLRITEKGVGAAFRAGIAENQADIVGYMDIDLSTDIRHLLEMYELFSSDPNIQMVNGSRWAKQAHISGRKPYRLITSYGLVCLLKVVFGMKATDAICGFKFYRKDVIHHIMNRAEKENGWFYVIELLIRAEKEGIIIHELPVRWEDDTKNSTVKTLKLITNYIHHIVRLKKTFISEKRGSL